MASIYSQAFSSIAASSSFASKQKPNTKVNELGFATSFGCRKKEMARKSITNASMSTEVATKTETRQILTKKKQLADRYRQGIAIEGGVGYRQTVVIRSSEVGSDKNATVECILNLLQETAINHLRTSGIVGDGFGVTPGMLRNNLIWVVTKLTVEIDNYPTWDEVMEVDTWLRASGKNGVQKDWTIRNLVTGQVHARATSIWMMMNEKTRRLSKIPDEVRAEISPFFLEKKEIQEETAPKKIEKLVNAKYINRNLKPKRSDIDMNHHVNNVKYSNWMLEAIPEVVLEEYQLSSITLEFRRECGVNETIQSLCQPDDENNEVHEVRLEKYEGQSILNGYLPYLLEDGPCNNAPLGFTHLLQVEGDNKNEEIVRGRTTWKRRSI